MKQLTLICVSLVLTGFLAQAQADQNRAPLLYEEALSAFNDNRYREAIIHVKNALLEDPTLISAHLLLARIYLKVNQGKLAEKEVLIAENLGADLSLTTPLLAQAYLQQSLYTKVVENIYPNARSPLSDAEIYEARGEAYLELGQFEEALDSYQRSADLQPDRAEPLIGRAQVMLRKGELNRAEAEATAAIARQRDNPEAWYLKGSLTYAQGEYQQALAAYERAVSLEPEYLHAKVAQAGVLMDLKRYREAGELIQSLREKHPKDVRLAYLQSVILAQAGDEAAARSVLREAADIVNGIPDEELNSDPQSMILAGLVNYSLKQYEIAQKHLHNFLKLRPGNIPARKLMGKILLVKGEVDKALDVLEPALPAAPQDIELLTLLGNAYNKDSKYVKASDLLNRALRLNPRNTQVRVLRAYNEMARGQENIAVEELGAVFEESPDIAEVGVNLYLALVRQLDYAGAAEVAEKLVSTFPENTNFLNLLAVAYSQSGRVEQAMETYDELLARDPDFLPAQINLGILYRTSDPTKGLDHFEALAERQPENQRIALEVARSHLLTGNLQTATRILEKIRADEPERIEVYVLLADIYLQQNRADQALAVAQAGEAIAPADLRILELLGRVYMAKNEKPIAHNLYRRLSKDVGQDPVQLQRVARLQEQAGDLRGAIWSLQKAIQGDDPPMDAQIRLAYLLLQNDKADKAIEQANRLSEVHPDEPWGNLILGDIYLQKGEYAKALGHFTQADQTGAGPEGALGVSKAQKALGQIDQALASIDAAKTRFPDDLKLRMAAGELFLDSQKWQDARKEYEYLQQKAPDHPAVLNNLAMIYDQLGDPRAIEFARRSVKLSPKAAYPNDTLGWLLVRGGEYAEGLKYLRNAIALSPGNPEIRYHLAVALHRIGKNKQALRELDRALSEESQDAWSREAIALRQRLLGS